MGKQNLLQENLIIKLANSSLCCKYIDDVIKLATLNEFNAIEWDLNFIPPTLDKQRQYTISEKIKQTSIEVRYHLPYSYNEIAHQDDGIRTMSMLIFKQYINFIAQLNGRYAILHIGYNEGSQANIALESLSYLAEYSKKLNVTLCVENLIKGLTTDLHFLNDVLSIPNVSFCLDIGHADVTFGKDEDFYIFMNSNISKICHVHSYKTENKCYNHIPFSNMDEIKESQIISLLLKSPCFWFTMELERQEDQNKQIQLFKKWFKSITSTKDSNNT